MDTHSKHILSLILALALLFGCILPVSPQAQAVPFENTYVNTGDQRADIIGVALTQLGYQEGPENDTKYGTWIKMPLQPWCASFVSWCAEMADIPDEIIHRTARANPAWFELSYKDGSTYTPKPGDLFFSKGFTHTGLVYQVEGDSFYTLEGNSNDNGSDDGTGVFSNKRTINRYYFSSPDYQGGDKAHSYQLKAESAHPHKTYYKCTTCGDQHYTGKTTYSGSCRTCTACGCTDALAGSYVCIAPTTLRIRSGHSDQYSTAGYVPAGGNVQVLAATKNGWAHIRYEAYQGYVSMEYLITLPETPAVSVPATTLYKGDTATVSWAAVEKTDSYQLDITLDDTPVLSQNVGSACSYTLENLQPGTYTVQVCAVNRAGISQPGTAQFGVLNTYPVTYDLRGGTDGPDDQIKRHGIDLTLSESIPSREGFTFLGWSSQPDGNSVNWYPGETLTEDAPLALHAVWKANEAVPQALEISKLPDRTKFVLGDTLDPTGLVLQLTYSDGSQVPVTEGFTTSQILAQQIGPETVTVTYGDLQTTYEVQILEYIPGDLTGDRFVNRDDVMWLLWHISFPEQFPITIPADFTGDEYINRDDVMHLLWHISFPEQFPIGG